jgi:hypothetical protein
MFALSVVVVLVGLALPAVQALVARNELARATEAAFEMVRFAQVHAAMRGRAYGIFVDEAGVGSNGTITVYECSSTACCAEDDVEGGTVIAAEMRALVFGTNPSAGEDYPTISVFSISPATLETDGICIKANGRVVDAGTGQPLPTSNAALGYGSVEITLVQKLSFAGTDAEMPPSHQVVIEYGGDTYFEF